MGYADMLHRTMSVVAVWSVMTAQGDTNVAGYRAAGIVSGMAVEGGNHLPPSQCRIPPATHPPTHPTTLTRSQVFYVIACLFVFWLMLRRSPLPPHFAHMRLRLRGQASLLLRQRRAWLASLATTTLDSFGGGFILSAAFDVKASAHNQGSRSGAGQGILPLLGAGAAGGAAGAIARFPGLPDLQLAAPAPVPLPPCRLTLRRRRIWWPTL